MPRAARAPNERRSSIMFRLFGRRRTGRTSASAEPPNDAPERAAAAPRELSFVGEAGEAVDALMEALAVADVVSFPGKELTGCPEVYADLLLLEIAETRTLGQEIRAVAADVMRHMLASGEAFPEGLTRRIRGLSELARETRRQMGRPRVRGGRSETIAHLGSLIREIGVEQHGLDVMLGRRQEAPVALAFPLHPVTGQVWLLDRLFDRLEAMHAGNPLLLLERTAAMWYFRLWSDTPGSEMAFARSVREQEWTLLERPTIALEGRTVLEAFLEGPRENDLPAGQRHLARTLASSFLGVFRIEQRSGDRSLFRDPLRKRTIEVHEHNGVEYGPGCLGMGRLWPADGSLHGRSPGMVIFKAAEPDPAEVLAGGLAEAEGHVRGIVLERFVSELMGSREALPLSLQPASSRVEAKQIVRWALPLLEEAGLVQIGEPDEARGAAASSGEAVSGRGAIRHPRLLDEAVGRWLAAMFEQSKEDRWRGARRRAKGKGRRPRT